MKKFDLNFVLTLLVIVATVTASHVRLGGKVDILAAVNEVDHKYMKQELKDIKLAQGVTISDYFVHKKPIAKKKKKEYAGTPEMFYFE